MSQNDDPRFTKAGFIVIGFFVVLDIILFTKAILILTG